MVELQSSVYDGVADILGEALGVDREEITLEANLARNLGAESIDHLDIIFRLEKRFGIRIPKGELFPEFNLERHFETKGGDYVFSDEGVNYLRAQHSYLRAGQKEDYEDVSDIFTVSSIVRYIESKLEKKIE